MMVARKEDLDDDKSRGQGFLGEAARQNEEKVKVFVL